MLICDTDTIAAIATPSGQGGIAVVRLSGNDALSVLTRAFRPRGRGSFRARQMRLGVVTDKNGRAIDEAMAVYFPAPNSYTREDVCEIQCHGGRVSPERVLARLLELGARAAQPGEFTKRAFFNGRVDLSEAEAVMAVISAGSGISHRASVRQLEGGVSALIGRARAELIDVLSLIDACADYPDEMEDTDIARDVISRSQAVRDALSRHADARAARIVRNGASVVIAGRPNVGKSSLMNAITHAERAIVTDVPGTTRDVLTETVSVGDFVFCLSDTAGQRETQDQIEKIGVTRARRAEDGADVVLAVFDLSSPLTAEDERLLSRADGRWIAVLNKRDLTACAGAREALSLALPPCCRVIEVSAKTGAGVEELIAQIVNVVGADAFSEDQMTLARHIECAQRAILAIDRAVEGLKNNVPLDFASVELSQALSALGDITGETLNEEVISRVFENFCVGK